MEETAHEQVMSAATFVADFFERFRQTLLSGGCLSVHRMTISFDLLEGEIRLSSDSGESESDVVYSWLSEDQDRAIVTEKEALLSVREAVRRLSGEGYFDRDPFAMDITVDYQSGGAKDKRLYSHSDNTWVEVRHGKLLQGVDADLDSFMDRLLEEA